MTEVYTQLKYSEIRVPKKSEYNPFSNESDYLSGYLRKWNDAFDGFDTCVLRSELTESTLKGTIANVGALHSAIMNKYREGHKIMTGQECDTAEAEKTFAESSQAFKDNILRIEDTEPRTPEREEVVESIQQSRSTMYSCYSSAAGKITDWKEDLQLHKKEITIVDTEQAPTGNAVANTKVTLPESDGKVTDFD